MRAAMAVRDGVVVGWGLAVVGALVCARGVFAAPPTYTTAALTGRAAAGVGAGVMWATLPFEPLINEAGAVAFYGTLSGTGVTTANGTAIWSGAPGALTLVARTGDAAPGSAGAMFATLGPPVFSAAGLHVGFQSLLAGAGVTTANDETLWVGPPGGLVLAAREGNAAPGTPAGVIFAAVDSIPAMTGSAAAEVSFTAEVSGAGVTAMNSVGLWGGSPAALTLVARTGSAAPGTAAGVTFSGLGAAAHATGGQVAFVGSLTGTGVTAANSAGIWAGTTASVALAARTGSAAPGSGVGVNFGTLRAPSINAAGQVAFGATLTGTAVTAGNSTGVWVGAPGSLVLAARSGSAAPGAGAGVVFAGTFSNPVINHSGQVAFTAALAGTGVTTDNDVGLWVGAPGSLTLVAREGAAAPGAGAGVVFRTFPSAPVINAGGRVAFAAFLTGSGVTLANDSSLWAMDAGGVLTMVARKGTAIPVGPGDARAPTVLSMLGGAGGEDGRRTSFNDAGRLAFRAAFADGSAAMIIAQLGSCRADADGDGQILPADVAAFVGVWFAAINNGTLAGDFDGNGQVQPADVAGFVGAWFGALTGGC